MILGKSDTAFAIEKLLPKFHSAITQGFNDYYSHNKDELYKHRPSTRATVVYDNIVARLKEELINDDSVKFNTKNGLLTLIIKDKFLVKIKKLDDNHKSSNIKTKQNSLFLSQQPLFNFDVTMTHIEIGYVIDAIICEIKGIFVVCPKDNKSNYWVLDLDEHLYNIKQSDISNQPEPQIERKQRFKINKKKSANG